MEIFDKLLGQTTKGAQKRKTPAGCRRYEMGTVFALSLVGAQHAAPAAPQARLCAVPSWLATVGLRYIVPLKEKAPTGVGAHFPTVISLPD